MDVFSVRDKVIDDYRSFTTSAISVKDRRLDDYYQSELDQSRQWPEPWISLNPTFEAGGSVDQLVTEGLLHPECSKIFAAKSGLADRGGVPLTLHRHQREAIEVARTGKSYVLTTGTGSGKSLAYIIPIVDHVLRQPRVPGVKAIIVYPMNALANSQQGELEKFLINGYGAGNEPVTFARYTGQEQGEERERILRNPPDILLTNYVMLDLVLMRPEERSRLVRAAKGLQFLVLDELHTYRGRQGADVAMLVRRVREACQSPALQCVGTSATMTSGGTSVDQKRAVAQVASEIFGDEVTPDEVIGETLTRSTASGLDEDSGALADAVRNGRRPDTFEGLTSYPLSSWIESAFGLHQEHETGKLVRQMPRRIHLDAAPELSEVTGVAVQDCEDAIRATLMAGSRAKDPRTGRPLFAFRLHQFLSKGDTLYVSLEPEADRHITSKYQVAVPSDPGKLLFPLAFCRECGQEYLVVRETQKDGETLYQPRSSRDVGDENSTDGYLYVSTDFPWPEDPIKEGRLPDSWLDREANTLPSRRKNVPVRVNLDVVGNKIPHGGTLAAFIPTPFLFCLSCGVVYEQTRGRDFSKLATLDAEGRSSAVSVLSTSLVRALRSVPEYALAPDARKLLTFVDNRQDASLQAGHLNDFVQVAQLRSALYTVLLRAPDRQLTQEHVASAVVRALDVPFEEYASSPEAVYGARTKTERAFRQVVEYRLYVDLKRGWRVTMPNLEQTGLLQIRYESLSEICHDEGLWDSTIDPLREAAGDYREELCSIMLDEFRKVLAIDVPSLTEDGFAEISRASYSNLTGAWSIPEGEQVEPMGIVFPFSGRSGQARNELYMTGRSAVGRYLRRQNQFPDYAGDLTADDAGRVIRDILAVLASAGLLQAVQTEKSQRGYRLKASALLWEAGDGTSAAADPLRKTVDADSGGRINTFFRDLYREGMAQELRGIRAREHTAQVSPREREERENAFRKGELPLLYCSPTMELGVDIASLNAVGMRNVPPTPANYAQRSGRAGRSGQPALVMTYCATGNAHDQYYFRNSEQMVSGAVAPPRLDLTNEALLRSHMQAIWLAETGEKLGSSMTELLQTEGDNPALALLADKALALSDSQAVERAIGHAQTIITPLSDALAQTSWWHDSWLVDVMRQAPAQFDQACDRWRKLFRDALADQAIQNRMVLETSSTSKAREAARRRRTEAESQLKLLRNEDSAQGFSDFYPYRYFASEGFLPGYSFPRLPLAAYIPGQGRYSQGRDGGDYLQRPRFLAINEFGPGALIYHEGARYEVTRVQVPLTQDENRAIATSEAAVCDACGYFHERRPGVDVCESCGEPLGTTTRGLMQMTTVYTRRRQRISSDEEERRRAGFELRTSYRFSDRGNRAGSLSAEVLGSDGSSLAQIVYGDSATVRVENRGLRRRKDAAQLGFYLDPARGTWLSETKGQESENEDEEVPDLDRAQRVIPYVQDYRNILVFRLAQPVEDDVAVTLRHALERGIETAFQLEDSELSSESLPDDEHRGRMLLTESSEGGAGVLRRLHADPDALQAAARTALELAHFDPATGEDKGAAQEGDPCERACYECLLSYGNQSDHPLIDRHLVRDLLLELSQAHTVVSPSSRPRDEHVGDLLDQSETELEKRLVRFLQEGEYRLPDQAQVLLQDAGCRPDFFYSDQLVAVFVDGPVHERADKTAEDAAVERRLLEAGYEVVRFVEGADWAATVRERADIFGSGRSGR